MSPPRQNRAASGQGPASPLFSPAAVGGPPRCSAPLHYSGPRGRGPARSSRRGPGHPVPRRPPLAARGARTLSLGGMVARPPFSPPLPLLSRSVPWGPKEGGGGPVRPPPHYAIFGMRPHAPACGRIRAIRFQSCPALPLDSTTFEKVDETFKRARCAQRRAQKIRGPGEGPGFFYFFTRQTSSPFSASSTSVEPELRSPERSFFAISVSAPDCRQRRSGRAP